MTTRGAHPRTWSAGALGALATLFAAGCAGTAPRGDPDSPAVASEPHDSGGDSARLDAYDSGGDSADSADSAAPEPAETAADDTGGAAADDTGGAAATTPTDGDGDGFLSDVDCDDTRADTYPGAEEVCGDGSDNDCDDDDDGCDPTGTRTPDDAHAALWGGSAGGLAGKGVAIAPDLNGDGLDDLIIGCAWCTGADVESGRVFIVLSPVSGEVSLTTADARLDGMRAQDQAGNQVAGAGDLNGDGYGDVLVGSTLFNDDETDEGAVFAVFGPVTGAFGLGGSDAIVQGDRDGDHLGRSMDRGGDIDGDGVMDVIVGANGVDVGDDEQAGAAYVLLGPVTGELHAEDAATATLWGEGASWWTGSCVASAGDVDGDGLADAIVGAYGAGIETDSAGYVGLAYSPTGSSAPLSDADVVWWGTVLHDGLGRSVDGAGDLDGDGYDDVVMGAHYESTTDTYAGAAYVDLGGPALADGGHAAADVWAIRFGPAASDQAGDVVVGAGDVNGDGRGDVIVGGLSADGAAGAAWLLLGPVSSGGDTLETADVAFSGGAANDLLGIAIGGDGDVNADGYADLLLGARGADGDVGADAGVALLYLGTGR